MDGLEAVLVRSPVSTTAKARRTAKGAVSGGVKSSGASKKASKQESNTPLVDLEDCHGESSPVNFIPCSSLLQT
eukprot:9472731-Pyramimonas_sp.AAC.1